MAGALIWLGFLLGLRHALEADHLTAVAALATGGRTLGQVLRVAAAWGLGHALVLSVAGGAMLLIGADWPPWLQHACEVLAAGALIWIGVGVIRRSRRVASPATLSRALAIGGLHGLEGSGAVVLLALPAVRGPGQALACLGAFGLGSIAGMLVCSCAVSLPLGAFARRFVGWTRALELTVGATSVAVGLVYMRSIFQ
jgi:high-affinity nickel-transport protein